MAAAVEWGGDSGEDRRFYVETRHQPGARIEGWAHIPKEGPNPKESETRGKQAMLKKSGRSQRSAASIDICAQPSANEEG
jgi:hypothetical protein